MSRLWPEAVQGGLFPGNCWLAGGKGKRDLLASVATGNRAPELLQGLEQCLIQTEANRKGWASLSLVVSDSIAAIAPLAWQDGLNSQAELHGYARICFEKFGYDIGADWVLHVEYPRYGVAGLAYAMSRDWLASLVTTMEARRMRLTRVLPISAMMFGGGPEIARAGLTAVLLFEATQHCVLLFENGALVARDVEPFAQSIEKTCHRLLARTLANRKVDGENPLNLLWWAYKEIEFPKDVIETHAANTKVTQVAQGAWS